MQQHVHKQLINELSGLCEALQEDSALQPTQPATPRAPRNALELARTRARGKPANMRNSKKIAVNAQGVLPLDDE